MPLGLCAIRLDITAEQGYSSIVGVDGATTVAMSEAPFVPHG